MTENEITTRFRQSKRDSEQVMILSQLNACKTKDIVEILLRNGFNLEDLPKRYRPKEGKDAEKPARPKRQYPKQQRDQKAGKIICGQCGMLFDGKFNQVFCSTCIVKRREEQTQARVQRDRERREAEYAAAGPKRCADCGTPLESRRATYCKTCAAIREKESVRRSNRRRYFRQKKLRKGDG